MGRAYATEIATLPATYGWAIGKDIQALAKAVAATLELPIVALGSGGSYTAASLLRNLHWARTGLISQALTPFEAYRLRRSPQRFAAWLLSARGRNNDILAAFDHVRSLEPERMGLICASHGSPLGELVSGLSFGTTFDFNTPAGRDGFLATNSLLATTVLMIRAYSTLPGACVDLPLTLDHLIANEHFYKSIDSGFWSASHVIVLYGPCGEVGAIDLESKFSEAALASVHPADYRNFAHGRHNWLATFGDSTSVIAFTSPSERSISDRTLAQLPMNVRRAVIELSEIDEIAQLQSVVHSLLITAAAGKHKGIDPGRPGVPEFGSKIYSLRTKRNVTKTPYHDAIRVSVERKTRRTIAELAGLGHLDGWITAHRIFSQRLNDQRFDSIIFDLDGTLLDDRFGSFEPEVLDHLLRLLKARITLGVATGRGDSARDLLRKSIPETHWHQVVVGYYNGSEIGHLSDGAVPSSDSKPCADLAPVFALLSSTQLDISVKLSARPRQLTLRAERSGLLLRSQELLHIAQEAIHRSGGTCLSVVRSSHSVDILSRDVTKTAVEAHIRATNPELECVLKIGDMGEWPGNDFELLNDQYGMSVDKVSCSKDACWNLLPVGYRGARGTAHYLRQLNVRNNGEMTFGEQAFR